MRMDSVNATDRPLYSDHPTPSDYFAILPHSPEGIPRVFESQLETIGYLGMGCRDRRLVLSSD